MGKIFEVMGNPAPPLKPTSNSVAGDAFTSRFRRNVLGAALGVVAAVPLLAPPPAEALTSCASVLSPLGTGDSCTIDDAGNTYSISIVTDTFFNAQLELSNAFWWGDTVKAAAAAQNVGAAFGVRNAPSYGPLFASGLGWSGVVVVNAEYYDIASSSLLLPGQFGDTTSFIWARSSLAPLAPSGGTSSVPGPLPALGLAAAFGFSRKLRNRIKLHRGTSAVTTSPGA